VKAKKLKKSRKDCRVIEGSSRELDIKEEKTGLTKNKSKTFILFFKRHFYLSSRKNTFLISG